MRHSQVVKSAAHKAIAVMLALGTSQVVAAQDMSFDMEETERRHRRGSQAKQRPPRSRSLRRSRLQKRGRPRMRWPMRSSSTRKIATRKPRCSFSASSKARRQDTPGNQQKAQFFLGKSLYHLQLLPVGARGVRRDQPAGYGSPVLRADACSGSRSSPRSCPSRPASSRRSAATTCRRSSSSTTARARQIYAQLLYLLGRSKYSQGEFEQAIELFEKVPASSKWYVQAQHVRGHLARAHAPGAPRHPGVPRDRRGAREGRARDRRARSHATISRWLSLARMYYTAANKVDRGDRRARSRRSSARRRRRCLEPRRSGSEYWLDALFEGSFAFFLADEYSRAMGNIHTMFSPYFENSYYPEALVLKAVIFFYNCQMENAAAMVTKFHERYDPVQTELDKQACGVQGQRDVLRVLDQGARRRGDSLSPSIRGIVSTALSDRTVLRHLEYVKQLEAEEANAQGRASGVQELRASARASCRTPLSRSRSRWNRPATSHAVATRV